MTTSAILNAAKAGVIKRSAPEEEQLHNNTQMSNVKKSDSQEDTTWNSTGYNYVNPFVHQVEIVNKIDVARIYVFTVLMLPIRVVGCVLSLVTAWMFACIGLYGMTLDDIKKEPLSGWRKKVQYLTASSMRMLYASGSFHYVQVKGKRALPKEAPVLVVAPHSSYVDSIFVVTAGPPSIVAKQETSQIPLLGKIINFAQPIYVKREDPNSRQNTIREIRERAHSAKEWPQIAIFAEGTCTNRKALIKFKPGAFYPGVPVQPVLLKYPNKYDTTTWAWDGPGVLRLLWLTMTQFYNKCEIEYLPVYKPSEAEKADANLYAENVRAVMANALGVPTSDYSFEDVIVMNRAKDMKIPFPGDIVEIERTLYKLGLMDSKHVDDLIADYLKMANRDKLDALTFSKLLQVDPANTNFRLLFSLLDNVSQHTKKPHTHTQNTHTHRLGTISLKRFLISALFCRLNSEETITFLRAITDLYAESSESITRPIFAKIMHYCPKIKPEKYDALYFAIDQAHMGKISFDEFESYTKQNKQYSFLYKKHERIRRNFTKN